MPNPITAGTMEKLGEALRDKFEAVLGDPSSMKGGLHAALKQFQQEAVELSTTLQKSKNPPIITHHRFGYGRTGHKGVVLEFLRHYETDLIKIAASVLEKRDDRFSEKNFNVDPKIAVTTKMVIYKSKIDFTKTLSRQDLGMLGALIVVKAGAFKTSQNIRNFSATDPGVPDDEENDLIFGYFQANTRTRGIYGNSVQRSRSVDTARLYGKAITRLSLNEIMGAIGGVDEDTRKILNLTGKNRNSYLRPIAALGEPPVYGQDTPDRVEITYGKEQDESDVVFEGVPTGYAGNSKTEVKLGPGVVTKRNGLMNALYGLVQWALLYSTPMIKFLFGSTTLSGLEAVLLGDAEVDLEEGSADAGGSGAMKALAEGKAKEIAEKTGQDTAKAKKIDAEDFAAQIRAKKFREQCFLVDHYNVLIPKSAVRDTFRYFTSVEAEPALVASRISGIPNLKPLMNAKNIQFSGLVPKMRFYKMVKKADIALFMGSALGDIAGAGAIVKSVLKEAKKKKNKKKKSHEYVEYEIPFQSSTSKTTIEEAFSATRGRKDGVGLRSFEYNFIGANTFEIERNIECKMSLFFRNLEDLATGSKSATFLDLILFGISKKNPQVDESGKRVDFYDADMDQMKVVVGWEAPTKEMKKHIIKDDKLAALIKRSVLTLRLVLAKHSINMENDGSGTVDIEFTGWIESKQRSVERNLLRFKGEDSRIIEAQKKRVKVAERIVTIGKKRVAFAKKQVSDGPLTLNTPLGDVNFDVFGVLNETQLKDFVGSNLGKREEKLRQERKKLNVLQVQNKTEGYSKFLARILVTGKIYEIDIPIGDPNAPIANSILGMVGERVLAHEEDAAEMRMNIPVIDNFNSLVKEVSLLGKGGGVRAKLLSRTVSAVSEAISRSLPKIDEKSEAAITDEEFAKMKVVSDPTDPKNRRIYFTFIGDVLQAGFSLYKDNINDEVDDDLRYLFGTIPFYDTRNKTIIRAAIVDIPITLNNVISFWFDKVVRPNTPRYDLRQFIIDVMNDLVIPNFGGACYPDYPVSFNLSSVNTVLEGRGKGGKDRVPARARVRKVSHIGKNPGLSFDQPTPKLFFYDYIYFKGIPNTGPSGLRGNATSDSKNGLFHFFIGGDRGLLKRVEFDKIDAPYYREFRTLGDENNISEQLAHPYKVNLTCIGNNLFRVGMYVYINPRLVAGNAKLKNSLAYKMNMGGYAMVYRVSNLITPGSFETKLECHMLGLTKFSKGKKGKLKAEGAKNLDMTSQAVYERSGEGGSELEFTEEEVDAVAEGRVYSKGARTEELKALYEHTLRTAKKGARFVRTTDVATKQHILTPVKAWKEIIELSGEGYPDPSTYDIVAK